MAPSQLEPNDFYPLGLVGYVEEILGSFPDEVALIGAMTVLWNNHEHMLRQLFVELLRSRNRGFAEAIWDQQITHDARRKLLSLAIEYGKLTDTQRIALDEIIERTKTMADRRNALIHGEYVVNMRTDILFAKTKSPRSTKPPKYQKHSKKDLTNMIKDLESLMKLAEALYMEFIPKTLAGIVAKAAETFLDKD